MANYTITLRTLINDLAPKDVYSLDAQIKAVRPKIFNFYYPIFKEEFRVPLEEIILRHYAFQEIGQETVAEWQFYLENFFLENMEKYNMLYQFIDEFGTNLFYQNYSITKNKSKTDTTRETEDNQNIDNTGTVTTTVEDEKTSNIEGENTTKEKTEQDYLGSEINEATNEKVNTNKQEVSNSETLTEKLVSQSKDKGVTDSLENQNATSTEEGLKTSNGSVDELSNSNGEKGFAGYRETTQNTENSRTEYNGLETNTKSGSIDKDFKDRTTDRSTDSYDTGHERMLEKQTGLETETYKQVTDTKGFTNRVDGVDTSKDGVFTKEGKELTNEENNVKQTTTDKTTDNKTKEDTINTTGKIEDEKINNTTADKTLNKETQTDAKVEGKENATAQQIKSFNERMDKLTKDVVNNSIQELKEKGNKEEQQKRIDNTKALLSSTSKEGVLLDFVSETYGWGTLPLDILMKLMNEYNTITNMILTDMADLFMLIY